MIIFNSILPDGHRVQVARVCCGFVAPDVAGKQQPHGMCDAGWKPYWVRVDGEAWSNWTGLRTDRIHTEWPIWAEVAKTLEEFCEAVGLDFDTAKVAILGIK